MASPPTPRVLSASGLCPGHFAPGAPLHFSRLTPAQPASLSYLNRTSSRRASVKSPPRRLDAGS